VGLGAEIDREEAKRAKLAVLIDLALIGVVLFLFARRRDLFLGFGEVVRIATVCALVILGWSLARRLGRHDPQPRGDPASRAGAGGAEGADRADTTPTDVQQQLAERITVPVHYPPHIAVEEVDGDQGWRRSGSRRSARRTAPRSPPRFCPRCGTWTASGAGPSPSPRSASP
jgi:hypothetical protein